MDSMQSKDLKYIWHPCSQMKDYEDFSPILIKKGEGIYLYGEKGEKYLDAVSSWWVNLFGHCNKRIKNAIKDQLDNLEHVIFANFTHENAIILAEKLVNLTNNNLNKVFYSDNGSSSVEVALKLSFHYHQQTGNTKKTKFVALTDAYHGETLGALSMGDLDLYSKIYKPLLIDTIRAKGPDCFRCKFNCNRDNCNAPCFQDLEDIVTKNEEEICGIIIEPIIQAAAGMKMYSPQYIKKLRKLCNNYKIHFIADEIAVGFGRTGTMFAVENAKVYPDIMCLSKGITGGFMPFSATLVTQDIYDAFYSDYVELKAFMHSHSYTGNPLATAAAVEVLKIFDEEKILNNNLEKSKYMKDLGKSIFSSHKYVGEYRQFGMVGAIELVQDKQTKNSFDWKLRVGYNIYKNALKKGLIIRPLGNIIYFIPPYVINENEIKFMMEMAYESINEYFK